MGGHTNDRRLGLRRRDLRFPPRGEGLRLRVPGRQDHAVPAVRAAAREVLHHGDRPARVTAGTGQTGPRPVGSPQISRLFDRGTCWYSRSTYFCVPQSSGAYLAPPIRRSTFAATPLALTPRVCDPVGTARRGKAPTSTSWRTIPFASEVHRRFDSLRLSSSQVQCQEPCPVSLRHAAMPRSKARLEMRVVGTTVGPSCERSCSSGSSSSRPRSSPSFGSACRSDAAGRRKKKRRPPCPQLTCFPAYRLGKQTHFSESGKEYETNQIERIFMVGTLCRPPLGEPERGPG